jgi:hypothetical protein
LSYGDAICCPKTILGFQTRGESPPFDADTTSTSSPRRCPLFSEKKTGSALFVGEWADSSGCLTRHFSGLMFTAGLCRVKRQPRKHRPPDVRLMFKVFTNCLWSLLPWDVASSADQANPSESRFDTSSSPKPTRRGVRPTCWRRFFLSPFLIASRVVAPIRRN